MIPDDLLNRLTEVDRAHFGKSNGLFYWEPMPGKSYWLKSSDTWLIQSACCMWMIGQLNAAYEGSGKNIRSTWKWGGMHPKDMAPENITKAYIAMKEGK